MDTSEIQGRLDKLELSLRGKTKSLRVEFELSAHEGPRLYMRHNPKFTSEYQDEAWIFFRFDKGIDTIDGLFDAAHKYVTDLPTKEEAERNAFLGMLGGVIEFGNKIGIEVEHINPLVELSKKLSENAITHQPSAA